MDILALLMTSEFVFHQAGSCGFKTQVDDDDDLGVLRVGVRNDISSRGQDGSKVYLSASEALY